MNIEDSYIMNIEDSYILSDRTYMGYGRISPILAYINFDIINDGDNDIFIDCIKYVYYYSLEKGYNPTHDYWSGGEFDRRLPILINNDRCDKYDYEYQLQNHENPIHLFSDQETAHCIPYDLHIHGSEIITDLKTLHNYLLSINLQCAIDVDNDIYNNYPKNYKELLKHIDDDIIIFSDLPNFIIDTTITSIFSDKDFKDDCTKLIQVIESFGIEWYQIRNLSIDTGEKLKWCDYKECMEFYNKYSWFKQDIFQGNYRRHHCNIYKLLNFVYN